MYTEVINKARAIVPTFDFNSLIDLEYQGPACTYMDTSFDLKDDLPLYTIWN